MAIQNRTILKGYFNTGDQPTEAQFHDLIDSQINLTDGGTVTGNISSSTAITASVLAAGSLTLDLNIESVAATDATAASKNHRFKVTVSSAGVVTYQHIGAAVMDAGTLAAPTTTAAYTFDDGDVVVPYLVVQGTNNDSDILLKSITVTRTPGIAIEDN